MAAVTSINISGAGPQREQSQKSYHRSIGNFIRTPPLIFPDEKLGQLSETSGYSELYSALRPFLILGKFTGIIPIQGLFQRDVDKLTFSKTSFPAILSVIIWGTLGFNVVFDLAAIFIRDHTNAGELAWVPAALLYYSIGLFACTYFYRHILDYINIMCKWDTMRNLTFPKPDTTLFRDLNLMALFLMALAAIDEVLSLIIQFRIQHVPDDSLSNQTNELEDISVLQNYYNGWNKHWAAFVPYHPLVAIVGLLSNLFVRFTWNYTDWTIALISRALYHKFKTLHEQGERLASNRINNDSSSQWKQLSSDLQVLCSMVFEIASFLSPIVFCSFGINVYIACLKLSRILIGTPNQTMIESFEVAWSVVHIVTRAYIVSMYAARINEWARRLGETFRKCPNEVYTTEVQRAEQLVSLNTIGLHGLGCFLVTKPLMLQLAGVVLTFEIVLLQFSQTSSAGPVVCATS